MNGSVSKPAVVVLGAPVQMVLPSTNDPPPLKAMVPIVESMAGAVTSHAQYVASAKLSGQQAEGAAAAYAGVVSAMAAAVSALLAPAIAGGDATAQQIVKIANVAAAKAEAHADAVAATAETLG